MAAVLPVLGQPQQLGQRGLAAEGEGALSKMLRLTRDVRRPRVPVGQAAFVVLGLARKMIVRVWEGAVAVDWTRVHLPDWAYAQLSNKALTDAALCAPVPQDTGHAWWAPVSETRPSRVCNHFLSLAHTGVLDEEGDPTYVDGFYARKGMAVVATVADGDCGIDALLSMLGTPSTTESRSDLRQD